MPLMLTPAERAMLDGLAAPVDANRRPEFLCAVSAKLEAAGTRRDRGRQHQSRGAQRHRRLLVGPA